MHDCREELYILYDVIVSVMLFMLMPCPPLRNVHFNYHLGMQFPRQPQDSWQVPKVGYTEIPVGRVKVCLTHVM